MKILLLNQSFYPDGTATSLCLSDLARYLVKRGHSVTALASANAYDVKGVKFPLQEEWEGGQIVRIWSPALGKGAKWRRILNFGGFWLGALLRLTFLPKFDVILSLTSPPLIGVVGSLFATLKGGRSVQWIMDMNPDEAVAAGWLRENSFAYAALDALQTWSYHQSARVIALDQAMASRLRGKGIEEGKIRIIPPWSLNDHVSYNTEGRRSFRQRHSLADKFVVMYSGNHSPCHPLDTVLATALELRRDTRVCFAFIGGGGEQNKVRHFAEEHVLENVLCLPYQPLEELSGSLSAADLHLVVMGEPFVGTIHPCKIYNILLLGIPFVCICPADSHLSEIVVAVDNPEHARAIRHSDHEGLREVILNRLTSFDAREMHAEPQLQTKFDAARLRAQCCDVLVEAAC